MVGAVVLMVVVIGGFAGATRPEGPKIALVFWVKALGPSSLILDGWEQAQRELDFEEATVVSLS